MCSKYDIEPNDLLSLLEEEEPENYDTMLGCLNQRLVDLNQPLTELLNKYEKDKIKAISASELKRNTSEVYQSDLYYTVGKTLLFIILFCIYLYFFNVTGIIQPIRDGIKIVNDKLIELSEVKVPKIKLPEVTLPSIKMPNSEK